MAKKTLILDTDAVSGVLEGRKTEHRLLLKPQPKYAALTGAGLVTSDYPITDEEPARLDASDCRYVAWNQMTYRRSDILYVQESYRPVDARVYSAREPSNLLRIISGIQYRADNACCFDELCLPMQDKDYRVEIRAGNRWLPAACMPGRYARIYLRVTDLRVEHLREIDYAGCRAEGIWDNYQTCSERYHESLARQAYPVVYGAWWDSRLRVKDRPLYGWEADPWVQVLVFELADDAAAQPTMKCEVKEYDYDQ